MKIGFLAGLNFIVLAALARPALAYCPNCCVGPAPTCTSPEGWPGRKGCVDGEWSGCIASPLHKAVVTVVSSFGAQAEAAVSNGVQSGGGKLYTSKRDGNLRVIFSADDTSGIYQAGWSGTFNALCGKANGPGAWTGWPISGGGQLENANRVSGSTSIVFSVGRVYWDATAPCAGGQPADEIELVIGGMLWNKAGQIFYTGTVTISLVSRLKVMTWNIRHGSRIGMYNGIDCGKNGDNPGCMNADAQRSIIAAEKPDIVLLQEVDVKRARSNYLDEPAYYAADPTWPLNVAFYLGNRYSEPNFTISQFGDVILSRFPLTNPTLVPVLHDQVGRAEFKIVPNYLLGYTLHVDTISNCSDGGAQVATMCSDALNQFAGQYSTVPHAAVFGGDFNTTPSYSIGLCYPTNLSNNAPREQIGVHPFFAVNATCAQLHAIPGLSLQLEQENPGPDNILASPGGLLSPVTSWMPPASYGYNGNAPSDHTARVSVFEIAGAN